jgi:hypothetical protein
MPLICRIMASPSAPDFIMATSGYYCSPMPREKARATESACHALNTYVNCNGRAAPFTTIELCVAVRYRSPRSLVFFARNNSILFLHAPNIGRWWCTNWPSMRTCPITRSIGHSIILSDPAQWMGYSDQNLRAVCSNIWKEQGNMEYIGDIALTHHKNHRLGLWLEFTTSGKPSHVNL